MAPQESNDAVQEEEMNSPQVEESSSSVMSMFKLAAASVFVWGAISTYNNAHASDASPSFPHRRLTEEALGDKVPTYMSSLMNDLKERTKLMEETPPEEVKYWFEYTGPLQVSKPEPLISRK